MSLIGFILLIAGIVWLNRMAARYEAGLSPAGRAELEIDLREGRINW